MLPIKVLLYTCRLKRSNTLAWERFSSMKARVDTVREELGGREGELNALQMRLNEQEALLGDRELDCQHIKE